MCSTKKSGCHRLPPPETFAGIRHVLFDMDGTIYSGKNLFPYTKKAFRILEELGISYTYLTNNSSIGVKDYAEKIQRLGLNGGLENVFTSSLATLAWLKEHYPQARTVYLLGTESLKEEFREAGYRILSPEDDSPPDLVIVAFDMSLQYDSLCKAAWWVKQNIPYVATHPDWVCPTDRPTVLIDCGALIECIASATGRRPDKIPGKPDPAMIQGILRKHDLQPHEVLMVGDRLYTDIEMAKRAGVVGVLVLSGEATLSDLEKSGLEPEVVVDHILVLAECLKQTRNHF